MSKKIPFIFKLDSKTTIGFSTESLDESLLSKLKLYLQDGIAIDTFYDDLFNDTVSNGHNLLKCNGIFTLDTSVVESMSVVIGKFLFRLLFTNTAAFRDCLHQAKKTGDKIEIKLEFNLQNKDSKELSQLPWELMYCPDSLNDTKENDPGNKINKEEAEVLSGGFFLSREAVIFREYKKNTAVTATGSGKLEVSVAFLTKDTDNLYQFYEEQKGIVNAVEKNNSNIHFEFVNFDNEQETAELLSKSDLSKVFLKDTVNEGADKIIHLICDIDTTPYKNGDSRAFYFNKYGAEVEKIAFPEIYRYLTDNNLLPDPRLKLLVLQAWKDTNKYNYAGFEEFAGKITEMNKENQTAILSMPYVLKEATSKKEMNPVFFSSLYTAFSKMQTITDAVKTVRNAVVPKYSYGFPLLYFSGFDAVLAGDIPLPTGSISQPGNTSKGPSVNVPGIDAVKRLLRHLDFQELIKLQEDFKKLITNQDYKDYINKIEMRLFAVEQLMNEKINKK